MHRCTNADSAGSGVGKYDGSVDIYRVESVGSYDSTQLRHQEMNAIQEEICNVIRGEGISLQTDAETPAQMFQLETAINAKLKASRIQNDSAFPGTNVNDALNKVGIEGYIHGLRISLGSTPSDAIIIAEGEATDSTGQHLIKMTGSLIKKTLNTGRTAYESWVAGYNNGGVTASARELINTFAGDTSIGSSDITDVVSTDVDKVTKGDKLEYTAGFPGDTYYLTVTNVSGTVVSVDRNADANTNDGTITLKRRFLHVHLIGKSTDTSAYDIVLDTDIEADNALSDLGGSDWDIYRRIGTICLEHDSSTQYQNKQFHQIEDSFTWADSDLIFEGDPGVSGTPIYPNPGRDEINLKDIGKEAFVIVQASVSGSGDATIYTYGTLQLGNTNQNPISLSVSGISSGMLCLRMHLSNAGDIGIKKTNDSGTPTVNVKVWATGIIDWRGK